jgi:hypothetical protein
MTRKKAISQTEPPEVRQVDSDYAWGRFATSHAWGVKDLWVERRLDALQALSLKGPMKQYSLQKELKLPHATIAKVVSEMLKDGEIERINESPFRKTGIISYELRPTNLGLDRLIFGRLYKHEEVSPEYKRFIETFAGRFPFYKAICDMRALGFDALADAVVIVSDGHPTWGGFPSLHFPEHFLRCMVEKSRYPRIRTPEIERQALEFVKSRPDIQKRLMDSISEDLAHHESQVTVLRSELITFNKAL